MLLINHCIIISKFHLTYADKELLEKEPRGEIHQEVLKRASKDLPVYTRTMSGGRALLTEPFWCVLLSDSDSWDIYVTNI